MNAELLSTLTDLSAQKHASDGGNEALAPFLGDTFTVRGSFVSSSQTFASRYDKRYEDGQTIIAHIGDEDIEVEILIHPDKNWAEDQIPILPLSIGETFEIKVNVLGFNSLYQRTAFGEIFPEELDVPEKTDAASDDSSKSSNNLDPSRASRRRARKSRAAREKRMERPRSKFLFTRSKSQFDGCLPLPAMPGDKYLKWFLLLLLLAIIFFVFGHILGTATSN